MGVLNRRRNGPSIEERIREALESVMPLVRIEGARVELVEFRAESGVCVLRLTGDCPDCRMNIGMLRQGLEAAVRARVPEIREIQAV